MGFPIALGMALALPENTVYCVCSDGEFCEGSCWEALRLMADLPITNVQLYIIANSYSAYGRISIAELQDRFIPFAEKMKQSIIVYRPEPIPHLEGVTGHYKKINQEEYLKLRSFYA
jgi:hypothetical protein